MIKFFRRIRKQLLSSGKTGKYLKYSIGEIILVVIGILIAFSLNNWSEEVKNRKQEKLILVQLKEEFKENLSELNAKDEMRDKMYDASVQLMGYYAKSKPLKSADSIIYDFRQTLFTPTFNPVLGVTNELLSSGKLYLLEDQQLKTLLANWEGIISRLIEYEEDLRNFNENQYGPYLRANHSFRGIFNGLWDDKELNSSLIKSEEVAKSLLANQNLEDYLVYVITSVISTVDESVIVRSNIASILNIIDDRLKKLK